MKANAIPPHPAAVADRLQTVWSQVRAAEQRYGRPPGSVSLLAVSKTKPAADIAAVAAAGQRAFGENYLQEAMTKMQSLAAEALEWHFIGPIQSNITRSIAEHFDWVHSVDRLKIAQRLSEQRPDNLAPQNICLQVNIDDEPSKAGFDPAALAQPAALIATLPGLRLRGLMAIPKPVEPQAQSDEVDIAAQRRPFARLRQLQESLIDGGLQLDTLSMGMSGDVEAAIAEGATWVRVGTAIFGPRATKPPLDRGPA